MSHQSLSRAKIVAYGLPGLIVALPVIPIAVLLPSWYARDLGLGFVVTGLALGFARLVDFATDLLVGVLCDRFNWHGYRYKPLVLSGAAIAGIGMFMLALPPTNVGPAWLVSGSLVMFFGWTVLVVPYTAWGAELSEDLHERSKLAASREVAGMCGMVLALCAPLVAGAIGDDATRSPLLIVAFTALALGLPAFVVFARVVPEPEVPTAGHSPTLVDVSALWSQSAFRRTLSCWLTNGIANGLPAVLFPIVVADYFLLSERGLFILLVIYFGAAIVAMPGWLYVAKRHGKIAAWQGAIACSVSVFCLVPFLTADQAVWFAAICFASGACMGADLALPPSIQADILGADRKHSGRRRSATAFACWSMATKLALAVAVLVAFVVIGSADEPGREISKPLLICLYVGLPVALKSFVFFAIGRLHGSALVDAKVPA